MVCLLDNLPEVQAQIKKLADIIGDEDVAYYVLSENNGYDLDLAPNGEPSKLYQDLLQLNNNNPRIATAEKAKVYYLEFRNWFGDWLSDDKENVSKVVDGNGEPLIVYHGSDSDFSKGFSTAIRGKGSGAPETGNEMYFNAQPWASLQYITGVNRTIPDDEGYNNWVKLWWEMKEILGNGRMNTDDWRNEIVGPNTRQTIPNKKGVFNRDKGGENGSYLSERKARFGYENRSDREFFEEVFDIRYGEETFNQWVDRKREEFEDIWTNRRPEKGLYPVFLNVRNPIIEEGQNTYYEEERQLFTKAKTNDNDGIISNNAKNEFNSDVIIVFNPRQNVRFIDSTTGNTLDGKPGNIDNTFPNRQDYDGRIDQPEHTTDRIKYNKQTKKYEFDFTEYTQRADILFGIEFGRIKNSSELVDRILQFNQDNLRNGTGNLVNTDYIVDDKLIQLLNILKKVPCKVQISQWKPEGEEDTLAIHENGVITFYADTIREESLQSLANTVAHEIMHFYFSDFIRDPKNKSFIDEVTDIKNELVGYLSETERQYYGLGNESIKEFINEFMTNFITREALYNAARKRDQPLQESEQAGKNAWQRLIQFFAKIVNRLLGKQQSQITESVDRLNNLYNTIEDVLLRVNSGEITTRNDGNIVERLEKNQDNVFPNENDFNETINNVRQSFNEGIEYNQQHDTEQSRKELEQALSGLTQKILEGQQKRLKVVDDPDPSVRARIKKEMEWQITNITNGLVDNITNITNFVNSLRDEVRENILFLQEHINNNIPIDDKKLNDLRSNFFDFYLSLLDDVRNELVSRADFKELIGKNSKGVYVLDLLLEKVNNYKRMLDDGNILVNREITRNATRTLRQLGLEVQDPTIFDYIVSNPEPTGDISWFTYAMGAGDKIKDNSIKSIFYLVNNAERAAKRNTYPVIMKLQDLLDKANKAGFKQSELFEFDDDGNPTGNIKRERNYGKMWYNYHKAMNDICAELGVDPSDLTLPQNRKIRYEYNRRRNDWLSRHVERQFTKEYYDLFNNLSQEARDQREQIQSQIRALQDRVRNDQTGIPEIHRLSPEDHAEYRRLQQEKKQLASIYDINGKRKQGIALQIAEELTELNNALQKNLQYKTNIEAFKKEKNRILNDKNLTQEQKDEWLRRNQRVHIKQEFWDKLKQVQKKQYGEKYEEFAQRRRAILNQYRDANGDIDVDGMPATSRKAITIIERFMRSERRRKKDVDTTGEIEFDKIAKIVPTEQYYRDRKEQLKKLENDPEAFEAWSAYNEYRVKDPVTGKIKIQPKSWYTKIMPLDDSYVEYVPSNEWMEISDKSSFYNQKYVEHKQKYESSRDEWWIPKDKVYDDNGNIIESYDTSEQYEYIRNNKELDDLYNECVEMLRQSYGKYGNLNRIYPYRMPQITGSIYRYMKAGWKRDGIKGAIKGFIDYFKDKLSSDVEEVGLHETATKPNGEPLNMIPQYFMRNLKDRAIISADLIGDICKFYYQSELWYQKTLIQPKVEILKQYLKGRQFLRGGIKTKDSRMARFAQEFINMNLYDIQTKRMTIKYGNNPSGKLLGLINYKGSFFGIPYDISGPKEIDVTKALQILKVLGTARNLALNIPVALTGMTTALHSHIINSLVGRYYNFVDSTYAVKDIVNDIFINCIRNLGLSKKRSDLSMMMELFEVGAEFMPPPTNRNSLLDSINRHWGFGLYTLTDHIVKGQILSSVMHNFKLVKNEKGEYTFMCREDYNKLHPEQYKHVHQWMLDNAPTFRDCVEMNAGQLVAKDPKYQKAVDAAKERIGNIARNLAQSADGQLTNLQKNVLQSNIMGQMFMMHRQYLPVILQERYLMSLQFDYQSQTFREGVFRTPIRLLQMANLKNQSILKTFMQEYKHDPILRENILKILFEISSFSILSFLVKPLVAKWADEDRRNWLKQLLAYVIERTSFEVYAPYNLFDMMKVINDPFAIANYVNTYLSLITGPFNIVTDNIMTLIDEDFQVDNNVIQRGAYRGWTKFEQKLMKLTPFKNLFELQDIQGKRNYYQKQIAGE